MMMKRPEWHEALKPREAVIAGLMGFAVVYPLIYYAYHVGYEFWGYSPPQWKNLGTAVDVLGFVIPYLLVKWAMTFRRSR
jgi:phosphotransferase system  glucose/maltose/N-acetylglucosamine-specific IIC component